MRKQSPGGVLKKRWSNFAKLTGNAPMLESHKGPGTGAFFLRTDLFYRISPGGCF